MGRSTARCWKRYGNNGVFHDSHKDANHAACAGTGSRPPGRKRRRMAWAKPQLQAAALGTPQSAEPQADPRNCRGAGAPANPRATAGTSAGAAERRSPGTGPPGGPHPDAAGGGGTSDTTGRVTIAGRFWRRDNFYMPVPAKRGPFFLAAVVLALAALAYSARADEISLKDGKKLYGVIVAYEENMFKVKTDYGYVLVEKDKIASITPTTPPAKSEPAPTAKKETPPHPSKPAGEAQPKTEPAVASAANTKDGAMPANASLKTTVPASSLKSEKTPSKTAVAAAKADATANTSAPEAATAPAATAPAQPKEPEVPENREVITGNLYTNYTHGFQMYKAPSWNLIEDARSALPNAIVAMGTIDESTLMVVGEEKTKESLDAAAAAVEKRLHDVYVNYQRVSQKKTGVGRMPVVDYRYRGKADGCELS